MSEIVASYPAFSSHKRGEIRLRTDRVEWYWVEKPVSKVLLWLLAPFTLFISLFWLAKKPKSQTVVLPLEQVSAARISDQGHGSSLMGIATASGKLDFIVKTEHAHELIAGVYRQLANR